MYNTTKNQRIGKTIAQSRLLQLFVGIVTMTAIMTHTSDAHAQMPFPIEYRVSQSFGKVEDVDHYAIAIPIQSPRLLKAHRLEVAAGSFSSSLEDRPFFSLGAVWRMPSRWIPALGDATFIDFGFSPTYIAGSKLGGRDIGGNLHFTSSLSIGRFLNQRRTVALSLRTQHTSNGGLDSMNPGVDLIGLNLTFYPDGN